MVVYFIYYFLNLKNLNFSTVTKKAGKATITNIVEARSPKIIVYPIDSQKGSKRVRGSSPAIVVSEVAIKGLNLMLTALTIDSLIPAPFSLSWFARSVRRIVLFTTIPARAMIPITTKKLNEFPVKYNPGKRPAKLYGIAKRISSG